MAKSHSYSNIIAIHSEKEEEEDDFNSDDDSEEEEEDSNFDDDSEEDPSYHTDLLKTQSKLSKLTLLNESKSRKCKQREIDDGEMNAPKLDNKEMKTFEHVQRIIDSGQVEKLKVEQCKVYLRKHGLRLTGKKDILIQRIKEHVEILKGGGEERYPPSSFILNCKGDACMGDVVMFEQTVYEGYSIVSRSANGPPCGKRIIAGRIVKESYGAAKQQHTFTVEVLWSKGDKPLPPLHPLLIKGRNLYKLDTRRQIWEDEADRQKVLTEKHKRGSVARSNREARIQVKMGKKTLKGVRVAVKDRKNSCRQIDQTKQGSEAQQQHLAPKKTQQQQNRQVLTSRVPAECNNNPHPGVLKYQPYQLDKLNMPASHFQQNTRLEPNLTCKDQSSIEPHGPQNLHHRKNAVGSQNQPTWSDGIHHHHVEYKENSLPPVSPPRSVQNRRSIPHPQCRNPMAFPQQNMPFPDKFQIPRSRYHSPIRLKSLPPVSQTRFFHHRREILNPIASPPRNIPISDECQHPQSRYHSPTRLRDTTRGMSYGSHATRNFQHPAAPWLRPSHKKQELCPHYPKGRCYFGNCCKFLHEPNRSYC